MLTTVDEKKIKKIIKDEVGGKLDSLQEQATSIRGSVTNIREQVEGIRGSVIKIERDRKILWDIWEFVKDHTHQLKNHEERITTLESSPD